MARITCEKKKNQWGPAAVIMALGSCLCVSAFYWDQNGSLSPLIAASYQKVLIEGEYWRLFTSLFAHADLEHYLSNMLMLGFLSYFTVSFYGLKVGAYAIVAGAIINLASINWIGANTDLVGASGVVYFLWGFWLSLYLCIQKSISLRGRLVRISGVFLILLIPTTYSPSTSYFAHYFGFFIGALLGLVSYALNRPPRQKPLLAMPNDYDEKSTLEWNSLDTPYNRHTRKEEELPRND